jgi:hypothetical protein
VNQKQRRAPKNARKVIVTTVDNKKLLTKEELASYFGLSTNSSWVNNLMKKGVLMENTHYRYFGVSPMFIREVIEDDIISGKLYTK